MQRNRSFEIFQFLAESVREAGQAAAVHPQRVVLFFNVACGNQFNYRIALNWYSFRLYHFRRGISALLRKLRVAKCFDY
jgi:hypothetical protein